MTSKEKQATEKGRKRHEVEEISTCKENERVTKLKKSERNTSHDKVLK